MTITEFLEARIAEDEAGAKACYAAAWSIREEPDGHLWVEGLSIHAADSNWDACIAVADAEHAVRHDPARVLAECAAKRAIIETFPTKNGEHGPLGSRALEALAAVYSDHPDYQQEWAL